MRSRLKNLGSGRYRAADGTEEEARVWSLGPEVPGYRMTWLLVAEDGTTVLIGRPRKEREDPGIPVELLRLRGSEVVRLSEDGKPYAAPPEPW